MNQNERAKMMKLWNWTDETEILKWSMEDF